MKVKILITGISGFVGKNLVEYFCKNSDYQIFGLDIVFPVIIGVDKIYSWDELSSISDFDVVIHLAGKAHDTKNLADDKSYYDINFGLSKKIFNWYLQSSASKFFLMSSVKAVADQVKGELSEDVLPNPITAYGKSKLLAEEYLNSATMPVGKKLYIFRPAMIHGKDNKGNLNLLYKVVSKGVPWPLAAFENQRSFVYIENLAFIFKQFIDKDIQSGTYNIADSLPISTNELISIISSEIGQTAHFWKIPKKVIVMVAKFGSLIFLPLNSERLKKLTENYIVSNRKLMSALQAELPFSAKEGLVNTFKAFKINN
jgi:nucleoside-diphosphate-sugar epimerase